MSKGALLESCDASYQPELPLSVREAITGKLDDLTAKAAQVCQLVALSGRADRAE